MVRVGLRQRGAKMADLGSLGIERNGVPVSAGSSIRPNELITLFADLTDLFGGDTVRFTIFDDATGIVAFGPVDEPKDLFRMRVDLDITGPSAEGNYTLEGIETGLFGGDTLTFPFEVSSQAPPPPDKPKGGLLGDLKDILIVVAVVAVAVMVVPRILPKQ